MDVIRDTEYRHYLRALLRGDRASCWDAVSVFLGRDLPPEVIYTGLFQRSLYEVGDLWEQSRVSVATEHLATATTELLLSSVYPAVLKGREPIGRKAVIACTPNEYHQIGARMVADVLEGRGWDTWFPGANTPVEDLLSLVEEKQPDVLGLSISIYFNMNSLWQLMETVRAHFPNLDLVVGGQAFRLGGTDRLREFPGVTYVEGIGGLSDIFGPSRPHS